MSRHQGSITILLVVAVMASGLHVPVIYEGHGGRQAPAAEPKHVHVIVHRHHGRLHVHVHSHDPHCHVEQSGDGADRYEGCDHERCDADHAPEHWLSVGGSLRDLRDLVAAEQPAPGGVAWRSIAAPAASGKHGRAPPISALSFAAHVQHMQTVILRL